ncbi:MAG: adenine deaminase [Ruminococcaceae bacterium]|nr:adenine deaminase [Oscillospiraceae bacterium]
MLNRFCKKPLYEVTRTLARVAMGEEKAELVIQNARLVNVCTAEIQEGVDVAITEGRIALVGDAAHCVGEHTVVIDAAGQYIAPGFMDAHIHVESSMITVGEYARAVVPRGTTGIFMDPHEICNVCGPDGVRAMIEDAKRSPLKAMSNVPSCVPAVAGFEDTGSRIGPEEVREMMAWDGVMGLGEMMNFPGVLAADAAIHGELAETLKADQVITGHYSVPDIGAGLNAYIASGVRCCHESTRAVDVLEKMRHGMYALMRYGSAWHDMPVIIRAILDNHIDDRFACLISDDTHPDTLIEDGHMDHIVRCAVREGLDPIKAVQYVTINPATCFRMDHELGSITPGKCADIVFFDDLKDVRVTRTIIDGEVVAENGKMTVEIGKSAFPSACYDTMHVGHPITAESFRIAAPAGKDSVKARVIEIIPNRVGNYERLLDLSVKNGFAEADPAQDVMKMAVFERHHATGTTGRGFVKGFGFRKGAMAQTVAHDAHNLLVAGTNDEDMALAANTLIACGGGLCAVADGTVLAQVPLPIAGLMNDLPVEEMAELVGRLSAAWREMGCTINSPYMTMALIPLACLPELRLTNRGLVDCRSFRFTELFAD